MAIQRPVYLDIILQQTESLRKGIWQSKTKTLIELLASSFIVFSSFGLDLIKYEFPFSFRVVLIFPAVLNAMSWVYWVFLGSLFSEPLLTRMRSHEPESEELESRFVYDEHEMVLYTLRRQKRLERIIDLLVASQFIAMGLVVASFMYIRFRAWMP